MDVSPPPETNELDQQSSFGIKKIVDCKIGEGGRQMFKVKWQPTWEPAENLASCQHLIDKFWSFVNKAKINEEAAQEHRKKMRMDISGNSAVNIDQNFDRLSEDDKSDVRRLIARTNATSNQMLISPSSMLMSPQRNQENNLLGMARTPTHSNNQNFLNSPQTPHQDPRMQLQTPGITKSLNFGAPGTLGAPLQNMAPGQPNFNFSGQEGKFGPFSDNSNVSAPTKTESDESKGKGNNSESAASKLSNTASLKYLENFANPYVKVIIVCKICNKEASKFSRNWKAHYLTHVSNDEKPHKCSICSSGFVSLTALRKHEEKKHGNQYMCKLENPIKEEFY